MLLNYLLNVLCKNTTSRDAVVAVAVEHAATTAIEVQTTTAAFANPLERT